VPRGAALPPPALQKEEEKGKQQFACSPAAGLAGDLSQLSSSNAKVP